ncbi:hypothetical protein [Archaeoglobus profundus]|uniref:Uncharacterized protein n=1 Tax=Archaeoglobus profundus (strain DSM 5631 / JCM 9629 / NBRC 100127 / Av18) TaxID=572546 RepID=D2RGB5_ARCPA|nr:hypothetical protein [Archaeoglobus profundus]ADB57340.1 hypothetical protein Arcpr_0270 [Archaeoglobus profundus DSM 5631]
MRVTRVRFVGRIWKPSFLKDLLSLFENICEEIRINSFLANITSIFDKLVIEYYHLTINETH